MLILLRHGRTPHNADARVQGGRLDAPLDDVGRAQARLAGEYLRRRWSITEVVTNPSERTVQSVTEAGFGALPTVMDDRWSELEFGSYDDRPIKEAIADLGQRWEADIGYTPPGGESMATMFERVCAACDDVFPRAIDEDVLVVTHATPVKAATIWALGGFPSQLLRMRAHLGAITVIDHGPEGRHLLEYNRRLGLPADDDPVAAAFRTDPSAPVSP